MEDLLIDKQLYIGEHNSGKTKVLTDFFLDSINNNIDSSNILIIVRNKTLEIELKNRIYENLVKPINELNVFRFRGLVKKIILTYWNYITDKEPKLISFSESLTAIEYLIWKNKSDFFPNQRIDYSFIRKIFEKQQRRAENLLTPQELLDKSKKLCENELSIRVNQFLVSYNKWLEQRSPIILDYAGQLDFLHRLIKIKDVRDHIVRNYSQAFLIDDLEEAVFSEQKFYEVFWSEKISNFIYTANSVSGVRSFMGANPFYINTLKKQVNSVINLDNHQQNKFYGFSDSIYHYFIDHEYHSLERFKGTELIKSGSYSKMLDNLSFLLIKLKEEGYKPNDISIISLGLSEQLQIEIEYKVKNLDWSFENIKGAQILANNNIVKVILTMIRIIIFDELKFYKKIPQLDSFDFIQLLNIVGGLDYYYLSKLRTKFEDNIDQWIGFIKVYAEKSGYTTIKKIQSSFLKGLEFIEAEKYEELVYFLWKELIWQSDYFINNPSFNELKLFIDMLNKQIEIRQFFSKKPLVDFIHSLLKGDLSDRPDKIIDKNSDTLKLITIQRLCEINLTTPIQIWFDITSDSWQKSDNNNVYNYQLISPNWLESMRWTPQLEMDLIDLKLARLTKKTINLCSKKAYFLASESNIHGSLQTFDVLKNFLVTYTD